MTGMLKIAPSLLAADFSRLGEEVAAVTKAGADWIHLDIMDGHFVPNISFGASLVKALRPYSHLPFDVHLMISPIDSFIESFVQAGADCISVHPEATPHIHRTLQLIRSYGKKAGIALNPGTPYHCIREVLDVIDYVLIMTVNPGFGGQAFIEQQCKKIEAVRQLIDDSGLSVDLEVDGGIAPQSASKAASSGANILVAGTAIFTTQDYKQAIHNLKTFSLQG